MKTLNILNALITLSKFLVLFGGILAIGFFMFLPNQENLFMETENFQYHLGDIFWEVKSEDLQDKLQEVLPGVSNPMILEVNRVGISLPVNATYKAITIPLIILYVVYVFLILYWIGKIIQRIKAGDMFSKQNVTHLKIVGIMVSIAPILESIITGAFTIWINTNYSAEGLVLRNEGHLGGPIIILGLLIYALTLAFEQGIKLQEENELTV